MHGFQQRPPNQPLLCVEPLFAHINPRQSNNTKQARQEVITVCHGSLTGHQQAFICLPFTVSMVDNDVTPSAAHPAQHHIVSDA